MIQLTIPKINGNPLSLPSNLWTTEKIPRDVIDKLRSIIWDDELFEMLPIHIQRNLNETHSNKNL